MAATPRNEADMRACLQSYIDNGNSYSAGARAIDMNVMTFKRHVQDAIAKGLHLSDGAFGAVSGANLSGNEARAGWIVKVDKETGARESTYWRALGTEPSLEDVAQTIRATFEGIEPAKAVIAPQAVLDDLCTVYCLADMHIGQLSWGREAGEAYDTNIAVERLCDWVGRLVASAPQSKEAVILDVGDTTHSNDQTNQTPKSKHVLDVDSRYFRTIEETIGALSTAIELTLAKHEKVTVVILEGNHSPTSYIAILFALAERYRNEPRVDVRKEPGFFWVHRFGKNMLAATHGDKTTPQRAVMFLADEHADTWGATRHRFLWTGHLHSAKMQDIGGMKHEQLRAMTSRDAYAYSHAYVSRSQLQAITLHAETGELQRSYVGL